ncbi:reverse transcriptase domain-containing protein [Tanacetum coccineum]
MKLTDEMPAEIDIRLLLASHSYIYPLGIVEDVLVEVAEHVYLVDFVILDIKENEKRPFILGTPFLTTAKAAIKFDKGTITLRSGKSKISFHRILDSPCMTEKGVKNDIEPIATTMTVNRLVLEWEEKIKLHLERDMEFNQWRSKNFKGKNPTLITTKGGMDDEGEVTNYRVLGEISKRRAFWSLNEDILKITILKTNTPYPSRKIRRDLDNSTNNVLIPLDSWTSGLLVYKSSLSGELKLSRVLNYGEEVVIEDGN